MQTCRQNLGSIPKASRPNLNLTANSQLCLPHNRLVRPTRRLQAASDDSLPEGDCTPGQEAEARRGLIERIEPVYDEVRCGRTAYAPHGVSWGYGVSRAPAGTKPLLPLLW